MRSVKILLLAVCAGLAASCGDRGAKASADARPFAEILRDSGLAAADLALSAREQTPETAFQLGGTRFLRAFEAILQARYASFTGEAPFLPGMRAQLPANPKAKFDPAFLETGLKGALDHLAQAEEALKPATEGAFATSIPFDAIWLDIDADGARAEWEGLRALLESAGARADWGAFDGTVRFDTADAEWLAAYVHLVSGTSELALSFEPTAAIAKAHGGRIALDKAGGVAPDPLLGDSQIIDQIASVLFALDGVPDKARTQRSLGHFRAMISHNRSFWTEVATETDNDHEWLPNPKQTSAFGITITQEVSESWQAVLAELDDMLAGRTLIPFWRLAPQGDATRGTGINLAKLLENPPDMELVGLIQGASIAPYLEQGPLVTLAAMNRFFGMTQGDGLLFAVLLN